MYIHFQRCQYDVIQLVDKRTLVERVGIRACADAEMVRADDIIDSIQVKRLGIHQASDLSCFQHVYHRLCHAADRKSHLNSALFHDFSEGDRRCN